LLLDYEWNIGEPEEVESFLKRDVHNIRRYSYLSYLQPDLIKEIQN